MTLSIAQANLKPGTGKTTGSVWLAYAFHSLGRRVLLADCDPAGSALSWNDRVEGGMPFDVVGLPTRDAGRRLASLAPSEGVVVVDLPQMEDHERINTSVLRYVDEVTVPVTASPIEIERMSPIRDRVDDVNDLRDRPARLSVLLNRINRSARSGEDAREALAEDLGYDVLGPVVPRLERYSLSYGTHPAITADEPFRALAEVYLKRAEATA